MSSHPRVAVEEDYIASTTESSSTHINLDQVHLVTSDSKSQFSSSLKTVAFESSGDAQSFSTYAFPNLPPKKIDSAKRSRSLHGANGWRWR